VRIGVSFYFRQPTNVIPSDYRRGFISLLKMIYKDTEFSDIVISDNRKFKPYVFSVGFNKILRINSMQIEFSGPLHFNFSSGLHTMIGHLYNRIKNIKALLGNEIEEIKANLPPPVTFSSSTASFKTLGVAVLTRKNRENPFVLPGDPDFLDAINHYLKVKMESLSDVCFRFGIKVPPFKPVRIINSSLHSTRVRHYDGFIQGFRGIITLHGYPEVLYFIHEFGLGVRTSQGFGMVKVVKL